MAAPTVTHVCNHKTHGLRFVFCSGTKHKSESLFLCFKYELQVRLVCNQHLLSWKHIACLETLVYQKILTIYGSFKWGLFASSSVFVLADICDYAGFLGKWSGYNDNHSAEFAHIVVTKIVTDIQWLPGNVEWHIPKCIDRVIMLKHIFLTYQNYEDVKEVTDSIVSRQIWEPFARCVNHVWVLFQPIFGVTDPYAPEPHKCILCKHNIELDYKVSESRTHLYLIHVIILCYVPEDRQKLGSIKIALSMSLSMF